MAMDAQTAVSRLGRDPRSRLGGGAYQRPGRTLAARRGREYWYAPAIVVLVLQFQDAIYHAMFARGYCQLLDRLAGQAWPTEPRAILRRSACVFVEFSTEDAECFQLPFQRTIPGFEPSPASSPLAVQ